MGWSVCQIQVDAHFNSKGSSPRGVVQINLKITRIDEISFSCWAGFNESACYNDLAQGSNGHLFPP